MAGTANDSDDFVPPQIVLQTALDESEEEHERMYRAPMTEEERVRREALGHMADNALEVLRTGRVPEALAKPLWEDGRPLCWGVGVRARPQGWRRLRDHVECDGECRRG